MCYSNKNAEVQSVTMPKKACPRFKGMDHDKLRTLQNKVLGEIALSYSQIERAQSDYDGVQDGNHIELNPPNESTDRTA